jgi:DNA-binding CsgD family transcriptional regulator
METANLALEAASPAAPLTSREAEVLWWLAQGCTYERIGDRLGVSLHTVTTHIKNIYRKLEVHCAAAAVRRGIELELLG